MLLLTHYKLLFKKYTFISAKLYNIILKQINSQKLILLIYLSLEKHTDPLNNKLLVEVLRIPITNKTDTY